MRGVGDAAPYGWGNARRKSGMGGAAATRHGRDGPQGCPAIPPLQNKAAFFTNPEPCASRPAREGGRGFKRKKPDLVSKIV